ncbi:MAG: TonB-dependent receptor [Bryobacterales bacterium]|nr:TonB-dependent receptor [Bryobacterales bacterium]
MHRLLLGLCALTSALYAQSPLGTVTGLVLDPSGSTVPNASIRLRNTATNVENAATSNDSGAYVFANVLPGEYTLQAEAKGFKKLATSAFPVAAYRTVRTDLKVEVGDTANTVEVRGEVASVIQSESPSIATSLSLKALRELPTNLRSVFNNSGDSGLIFQMMPLTVPGLVQVGAGAAWVTPGAGANSVKTKVDGIETNFGNFGTPDPVSQPSMESVGEFTANILSNKAEFGGMGVVTSVTRSGGNKYHGDLFWYGRNSALDARNTFSPSKPFQNIHNYGATFGGPLKKDKTFFQLTFDQTRGSRAYLFSPNVPTLAMRGGDFTGQAALRNPYTGVNPFDGNRILPQFISPQARRTQELLFPLPNFGPATLTAANYRAAFNGPETHNIYEARLDQNWTSAHSSFARYQWKKSDYEIPGARSALPPESVGTSTNIREVHFATLGDVMTLKPNMFNEARFGFVVLSSKSFANVTGQRLIDTIGVQGLPARGLAPGIPVMNITGLSSPLQSLLNPVNDGHWQFSDNLTWNTGRHTLKFGGEYVNWFVNRYLPSVQGLYGSFSFTNRYTGNPYADFLLGLPTAVTRIDPYPTQYNRWSDVSFYAQDDWKISQRLTMSYGIRYEYNQPAYARDGNMFSFDPKSGSVIIPEEGARRLFSPFFPADVPIVTASSLGLPKTFRNADKNNWAPRLGFAYQLNNKTVLRGGIGAFYGHFSGVVPAAVSGGPFSLSTTANNNFVNGQPVFTFERPFAAAGVPGALNLNGIAPDLRNQISTQYSFTFERELSASTGIRVNYIGSKGSQLPYQRNINQPVASTTAFTAARRPYPRYNNIVYAESGANNLYNGLQVQFNRRFEKGLMVTSAWTWAQSLSEVDDTGSAELNTQIEDAYDRRRDRSDIYSVPRHQWMNQVLYELPFAKQNRFLGGWQISALMNLSTGNFLNPLFTGSDPSNTNNVGGRPDLTGTLQYPQTLAAWFDRTAFTPPPANSGRFGNAKRNSVVGPGYIVFNAGIQKGFSLERFGTLSLGANFQNVMNHVNYGQPNMTANVVNGGSITSTHVFPAAGAARLGQLVLRYSF